MVSLIYQISSKRISVKGGVYSYEAHEVKISTLLSLHRSLVSFAARMQLLSSLTMIPAVLHTHVRTHRTPSDPAYLYVTFIYTLGKKEEKGCCHFWNPGLGLMVSLKPRDPTPTFTRSYRPTAHGLLRCCRCFLFVADAFSSQGSGWRTNSFPVPSFAFSARPSHDKPLAPFPGKQGGCTCQRPPI